MIEWGQYRRTYGSTAMYKTHVTALEQRGAASDDEDLEVPMPGTRMRGQTK